MAGKKKTILITGGLGHIGSNLMKVILSKRKFNLVILDNLLTQRYPSLYSRYNKNFFKFYNLSILDPNIENIFKKVDTVIHLAAIVDAANSFDKSKDVKLINYIGTKNIVHLCSKYNCNLIFPSTTSVYGSQNKLVDENTLQKNLNCQSPYAEYKLKAENYIIRYAKKNNLNFIILRLGTIYGASIGMRFQTAVNKFCWQASLNEPLTIWKTALKQKRPYLGIDDAIKCFLFIINHNNYSNNIYNVLSSNNTVEEIINIIKRYKKNLKINFVSTKIMNQLSYEVSSEKIKKLGFKTKSTLKKGISDTIKLLSKIQND